MSKSGNDMTKQINTIIYNDSYRPNTRPQESTEYLPFTETICEIYSSTLSWPLPPWPKSFSTEIPLTTSIQLSIGSPKVPSKPPSSTTLSNWLPQATLFT